MKMKNFTLSLKHQLYINVRIHGCCQTGIELSKCVYLASMDVKINHIVGGQNREFFQNAYLMVIPVETWATKQRKNCEKFMLCPSKCNGIHKKFKNKIEFGCKFCCICHLGKLSNIDVLTS